MLLAGTGVTQSSPAPMGASVPALGVVEFRVLSTNFRDYAVVFTQLEFADEAFSTVELYSEWAWRPGPAEGAPPLLPRHAAGAVLRRPGLERGPGSGAPGLGGAGSGSGEGRCGWPSVPCSEMAASPCSSCHRPHPCTVAK